MKVGTFGKEDLHLILRLAFDGPHPLRLPLLERGIIPTASGSASEAAPSLRRSGAGQSNTFSSPQRSFDPATAGLVEVWGFEPQTFSLRTRRSTS